MIKVLLSLFTGIFALALMIGGVYAVFSANTTNGPLTFQTGSLSIANTSGTWEQSWYANNLTPGDNVSYLVTVSNTGNVPMKLLNTSSAQVSGDLSPVLTSSVSAVGGWDSAINPGGTKDIRVSVSMDQAAGNSYMNKSGTVTALINAESTAH